MIRSPDLDRDAGFGVVAPAFLRSVACLEVAGYNWASQIIEGGGYMGFCGMIRIED